MSEPTPHSNAALESKDDIPKTAERIMISIVERVPGVRMRSGTETEDSGRKGIRTDPAVDMVGFLDDLHAFVIQATTASERDVLAEKARDVLARPFVMTGELDEGKLAGDPDSVPRLLVKIDVGSVLKYIAEPDIAKHPQLQQTVLSTITRNLKETLERFPKSTNKDEVRRLVVLRDTFQAALRAVQ